MDNQTKSKINLKDYLGKKVKLYLDDEYDIEFNTLVSMNMLLFTPKIFEYLDTDIKEINYEIIGEVINHVKEN